MVLTLLTGNISISGITVRGSGADLSQDDAVILLREAKSITVENCRIESRAFGIYLRGGGGHHILHNQIQGDASLPSARRGNGIHLWHSERNEIRDNKLVDVRDAVYLSFAHENLIAENRADHVRYGIHYMYSERNNLRKNHFANCTGGIALMFSMGNQIEGNHLINNRDFGILCLQLERSVVAQNLIQSNGRGLFLEHSANNRFQQNRLLTNGVGVFVTAGSEQNVFTENSFQNNLVQAFQTHPNDNDWFDGGRGNEWSDYSGFDWNHDGIGETPYKLQTTASALMARRPLTRWFWESAVFALLDWWEGFVVSPKNSSFDPVPLMKGMTP